MVITGLTSRVYVACSPSDRYVLSIIRICCQCVQMCDQRARAASGLAPFVIIACPLSLLAGHPGPDAVRAAAAATEAAPAAKVPHWQQALDAIGRCCWCSYC
jgi:hypothetical protein